jgi:Fe-S-cluster containining protein
MSATATWKQLEGARKRQIVHWLRAVGSRASVAQAEIWLGQQAAFVAMAQDWDGWGVARREAAAKDLTGLFRAAAYATRPFCLKCGSCCRNSGPTLYSGDEALFHAGDISFAHLRTLRAGEEVFSHWENRRTVLEHETVTIAPALPGNCPLLEGTACRVYDRRPAQCKAQKCWDTRDSDKMMKWPGLTRLDLVAEGDPLRGIITEHDQACAPAKLREFAEGVRKGEEEASHAIVAMVELDAHLRRRVLDEKLATAEALPFLLGRPIEMLVSALGLEITKGWDKGPKVRSKSVRG